MTDHDHLATELAEARRIIAELEDTLDSAIDDLTIAYWDLALAEWRGEQLRAVILQLLEPCPNK